LKVLVGPCGAIFAHVSTSKTVSQDPEGSLFNSDLVDFNAAPGTAVVPGMGSAAPITSGQAGEQLGNTASVMSFKFPFNNTLM